MWWAGRQVLRLLPIFWTCPVLVTAGLFAVVFVASHEISQLFEANTRKCFELLVLHSVQAYDDTHWNTVSLGKRIILNLYFYSVISNIFGPAFGFYQGKHSSKLLEMVMYVYHKGKGNSIPVTGLDRPRGFQEAEAPRCQDNRHMKVGRLSALRTGRVYTPTKDSWYSCLLEAGSTPGP